LPLPPKCGGKGIGFAGIGAKLSLLIAKTVVTETKGGMVLIAPPNGFS